ncbi:3-ketoacyl-ACP reductase [Cellulomonas sp. zg-ZUI222]|uniref:3-ketoacyl-ACP reductase n=1 Tax=Cellulomonas wangleii TaxID=2816956 RepID=A0ABX8D6W6_9CELL|nr:MULTISPECIES: 3-ketoacyl-ACP reductase [Cellulomonas]MBO0899263.1 3-ketoacyl-ACP reductase [Cellulomonas sp. zg-ZUI22]MBO0920114.1 3-ketoacyl-ACP reductase [Cellulomonas wangleii]MBO0923457.1 3-ketoacyl-ACP reductase [Cellulomonas wangleii]QVI61802.1 3-ketoacyl-ACP reductase [Cellulomonas wangleii]
MPPVALVTGGNRGIGLGISRRLVADGFAVSILATREEPADVLAELREAAGDPALVRYVRGSVADLDDHRRYVADAVDAWGRLDLLVNNAGVAPSVRADLLDATPESFDRVLGINLRGPYFLTQEFARRVIELRGPLDAPPEPPQRPVATIVNVSSISATTVSTNRGDYCVSKAGVAMATQLWAVRLAPEGVVVHEVRPGVIATDMTAGVTEKYDALIAQGLAPVNRWGRPADVAGAVALLASGQTPYSTGEVFHVDGGMHVPVL